MKAGIGGLCKGKLWVQFFIQVDNENAICSGGVESAGRVSLKMKMLQPKSFTLLFHDEIQWLINIPLLLTLSS